MKSAATNHLVDGMDSSSLPTRVREALCGFQVPINFRIRVGLHPGDTPVNISGPPDGSLQPEVTVTPTSDPALADPRVTANELDSLSPKAHAQLERRLDHAIELSMTRTAGYECGLAEPPSSDMVETGLHGPSMFEVSLLRIDFNTTLGFTTLRGGTLTSKPKELSARTTHAGIVLPTLAISNAAENLLRLEARPISQFFVEPFAPPNIHMAELPASQDDDEPLIRGRATLGWSFDSGHIFLQLPAVATTRLPATWRVGPYEQGGAATPDVLPLNSTAFVQSITLTLHGGKDSESQHVQGLGTWRLFDVEKGIFVNPRRRQFPMGRYSLISRNRLDSVSLRDFDQIEYAANEPYELADGTLCFVTQLVPGPRVRTAEVSFSTRGVPVTLSFGASPPIESRLFCGAEFRSVQFSRYGERLIVGHSPLVVVQIPRGYTKGALTAHIDLFRVYVDSTQVAGSWGRAHADSNCDYFLWKWAEEPELTKDSVVRVEADALGSSFEHNVGRTSHEPDLDEAWRDVPEPLLEWFLLSQEPDRGMKWEELVAAQKIVFPKLRNPRRRILTRYENIGVLRRKAGAWIITESRATFRELREGFLWAVLYCGDLSILWGAYRRVRHRYSSTSILPIGAGELSGLPFAITLWRGRQLPTVWRYLRTHGVRMVSQLWR